MMSNWKEFEERRTPNTVCDYCNKPIYRRPHLLKKNKGKHCSRSCRNKVYVLKEDKNPRWKGDSAGYSSMHKWFRKYSGVEKICIICSSKNNLQVANIYHTYKRIKEDYRFFCAKCHAKYDKSRGLRYV